MGANPKSSTRAGETRGSGPRFSVFRPRPPVARNARTHSVRPTPPAAETAPKEPWAGRYSIILRDRSPATTRPTSPRKRAPSRPQRVRLRRPNWTAMREPAQGPRSPLHRREHAAGRPASARPKPRAAVRYGRAGPENNSDAAGLPPASTLLLVRPWPETWTSPPSRDRRRRQFRTRNLRKACSRRSHRRSPPPVARIECTTSAVVIGNLRRKLQRIRKLCPRNTRKTVGRAVQARQRPYSPRKESHTQIATRDGKARQRITAGLATPF